MLLAALPDSHRVFGASTTFEPNPLTTASILRLQQTGVSELRVYVDGDPSDVSIDPTWDFWRFLVRWRAQGLPVSLIATRRMIAGLNWQERNALANHLDGSGIELRQVDEPIVVGGRLLALEIGSPNHSTRWAVSDPAMLVPGEGWGIPTETGDSVRVRNDAPLPLAPGLVLAPSSLRTPVPGTYVAIDVGTGLNGPVTAFGTKLFQLINARVPALTQKLRGVNALRSITYSDRYLRSPLSIRLLCEVIRWLGNGPGGITADTTIVVRSTFDSRANSYQGLTGNWPSADLQRQVSELVLTTVSKSPPQVEVGRRADIPHHRFLRLEWVDGTTAEIRFDQGLSGMQVARRAYPFDTARPAARQATELLRLSLEIEHPESGSAPIYVAAPS